MKKQTVKYLVWAMWVLLTYVLGYFLVCFINWDMWSFASADPSDRAAFLLIPALTMSVSWMLPATICDNIDYSRRW